MEFVYNYMIKDHLGNPAPAGKVVSMVPFDCASLVAKVLCVGYACAVLFKGL